MIDTEKTIRDFLRTEKARGAMRNIAMTPQQRRRLHPLARSRREAEEELVRGLGRALGVDRV